MRSFQFDVSLSRLKGMISVSQFSRTRLMSYAFERLAAFCLALCVLGCVYSALKIKRYRPAFQVAYCPWCDDPDLCRRPFLFIMASGRSGSTSLMAMINSLPGFDISGENDDELSALRAVYESRSRRSCQYAAQMGKENRACSSRNRRELLAVQSWLWEANLHGGNMSRPSPNVVGFKEIIWTDKSARFLQEVAPCSRFVLNMRRNLTAQAASGFFREHPDALARVEEQKSLVLAAYRTIPRERVFRLDLEDFSVSKFNALAAWLGVPCKFQTLAHANRDGTYDASSHVPCVRSSH
jgi:hypothetical protein